MLNHSNLEALPELVKKYQGAGPRYTSYPTALEFDDSLTSKDWMRYIEDDLASNRAAPVSLYLHTPFCKSLCYFCACNKIIDPELKQLEAFLNSASLEMKSYRKLVSQCENVTQIHWGGGSPSFLPPKAIDFLCDEIDILLPDRSTHVDISVEVDPRTSSIEQLKHFRKRGFNRLSMGVQDFNPEVQRVINRHQSVKQTEDIFFAARDLGFDGINIDLIYGLPGQTKEGFSNTIDKVIDLKPSRIALYGYAHVTWVKKVQKALERTHMPTPIERVEFFLSAIGKLIAAGYEFIGLDHFALPEDELTKARNDGRLNRNFMGYSTHAGARIIGIGPSAISSTSRAMAQNSRDFTDYQRRISESGSAIVRGLALSEDDRVRSDLIHSIMCHGNVPVKEFERTWNIDFWSYFGKGITQLENFQKDKLVSISDEKIELSPTGWLFARNIAMQFDSYLEKHQAKEKPVFSQTI